MACVQQLQPAAVDGNAEEVEALLRDGSHGDADGGDELRPGQFGKIGKLHALEAPARADGDLLLGERETSGQRRAQAGNLAAAADEEHRRRRAAVAGGELFCDGFYQLIDGGLEGRKQVLGRYGAGHAENIFKGKRLLTRSKPALELLRRRKIHEVCPDDGLGELVARNGGHLIGGDLAFAADRDIRGARADVHKGQIQKAKLPGDEYIDGGDGLQRQARNLQSADVHCRIESLDDAVGQKGCQQFHADGRAAVAHELGNGLVVHAVFDDAVAHAVVAGGGAAAADLLLRLLEGLALQSDDRIPVRKGTGRKFALRADAHGAQHTPCGRYGHAGEAGLQPRFQPLLHLHDEAANLRDVLHLAVHHGAAGMLHHFTGQHLKAAVRRAAAHNADDGARADVQSKDDVPVLFGRRTARRGGSGGRRGGRAGGTPAPFFGVGAVDHSVRHGSLLLKQKRCSGHFGKALRPAAGRPAPAGKASLLSTEKLLYTIPMILQKGRNFKNYIEKRGKY